MAWTTALDPTVEQVKDTLQKFLDNDNYLLSNLAGIGNRVINGDCRIAQRSGATTVASYSGGTYSSVDRFLLSTIGAGIFSIARNADHPLFGVGNSFGYNFASTVTTADTAIAATDLYNVQTRIEGYSVADILLTGGKATLSFWVKNTKPGIYCLALANNDNSRSWVTEYTVNAANTWEFKVIIVDFTGAIAAGAWSFSTAVGLKIWWILAAGTNFQTAQTGTWLTNGATAQLATANQVNAVDAVNNTFRVTDVQLIAGEVATPNFQRRALGAELLLCQRYLWKTFGIDTKPAQFIGVNTGDIQFSVPYAGASLIYHDVRLPVPMRAAPTVTFYASEGTTANMAYIHGVGACTTTAVGDAGDSGFAFSVTPPAASAQANLVTVHALASAEI